MYESLHNHTTASDGTQTYAEVLATAQRQGFGVMAFTDHDTMPTQSDLDYLRSYTGPVKWLLGCEISSGLPKELGGGPTGMFHILGLFTDPHHRPLLGHCRQAVAARTARMESMVANLRNLGFGITVDECLAASGGESVGRPHIVKALMARPEYSKVIDGLKQQMEAAAVQSADMAMKYMRMLERHESDYPYALFLSEDSFISGVYVDYLYSIDMDSSVNLIREAGGKAFMAHWPTIMRKISAQMVEDFLREGRLDGVELRSGFVDNQVVRQGEQLEAIAKRTDTPWTIGIDGHREADIVNFTRDTMLASKTAGQTKALIERFQPNLEWSNI